MTNKPRFVGERVSFTDAFSEVSRGVKKFKQNQYVEYGAHPIVDQGQKLIAGYSDDETGLFNDVPAIVFGDHTRCVKYVEEPFFAGADGVKILKPRLSDNTRFWWHELKATPIENLGYSRHFKLLKAATFKNYDTASQTEIVARLDSILDQIAQVNQQIEQLDQLIKSRFVEMFGNPVENLLSWPNRKMGELGELRNGVNFKASDSGFEIKCLGVGDFKDRYSITDMGLIDTVFLSGEPTDKQMLKDGDVVFVRSNGNKQLVGRCLAVFPGDKSLTFSGFCIRFRNESDDLLLDYLLGCLKSDSMRKAMVGRGANIQNLSQGIMSEIMIPIPPLELQQDFVAFVQQVDKLKFIAQQQIEKLQELYDSLAQEYFGS